LSSAQTDTRNEIRTTFEKYAVRSLTEKLFVHTDRTFYVVGESMWFKLYYLDGTLHQSLDLSKVAYVEVLDKDSNPVLQTKITLEAGKGMGSLTLPSSMATGTYLIRAYTNWMKNFSPDYFFEKTITIANPFQKPDAPDKPEAKPSLAYDVQFFPEGGFLLRNVSNKVAFRAIASDGKGFFFRGSLLNQQNDTLLRFQPLRFGIGHFVFTPKKEETYRVSLIDSKGRTFSYPLPAVQEQGFSVQVTDSTADLLKVLVSAQSGDGEVYSFVHLMAHTRQIVRYNEYRSLRQGKAVFLIRKSDLDEGISHLTLFNEAKQAVCERLVFRKPSRKLNIETTTEKTQYSTREKVEIDLTTHSAANTPVTANLSASVYLLDSLQPTDKMDLESYVWLSSDLKGTVESPSYYFTQSGPEVDQALDNLMLTHGWRRFRWEAVMMAASFPRTYLPEAGGHFIHGRIFHAQSNKPASWVAAYLSSPQQSVRLLVAKSDSLGGLRFEAKQFIGSKEIVVQTDTRIDSTYRIEISSPFSDQPSSFPIRPFTFQRSWKDQLVTRSINMQTQNAFVRKNPSLIEYNPLDSLAFFGYPDSKYFLDDYTRFPTMEEVMREYVPGVLVRKRQRKFHFMVLDRVNVKSVFKDDPLILVDGIPFFDTDLVMTMDPLKIKKLEVVESRYFLGPLSFPGIVSYSTFKNDLAGLAMDPRALIVSYDGMQPTREYYAPRYETPGERESRIPDFRNLLHWAPDLTTDEKGKQKLVFYSSDQQGTYAIVMQGMTKKGALGSKILMIEVKRPL
jgi:hypothetical protein